MHKFKTLVKDREMRELKWHHNTIAVKETYCHKTKKITPGWLPFEFKKFLYFIQYKIFKLLKCNFNICICTS